MKKRCLISILATVCVLVSIGIAYAGSVTTSNITAQTIINQVRRDLAEENYSSYFWSDTDYTQWIDQAVRLIVSKTKCLESSRVSQALTANTWVYSLSSYSFTDIEAVLHDSGVTTDQTQVFALERVQIAGIGHSKEKGKPKDYCLWNNELIIWPIPDSTQAGTTLYLYMSPKISGVTTTTSIIETPHYFDDSINWYVKAQAYYKDSKTATGDYFLRQFNAKLDEYILKVIKRNP